MRRPAYLSLLFPLTLLAQAPAPAPTASLADRLKAERPAIEQLMAEMKYSEAKVRAEALLPATKPVFDKTSNQTLVTSCATFVDTAQAYRTAVEAADAAGAWEKALEYAKTAKALATECYAGVKEPFTQAATSYREAGARANQVLVDNEPRLKELRAKANLDAGERQELDLAAGVEKEVAEDTKWAKFFQTYLDVSKRESEAYDPFVKVMEDKLKGEADQIADYKAGKGDKNKWVEAVVSSPAYLDRFTDKASKAQWLHRLATLDPESKKVQHQLDLLYGRATTAPAPAKKGKKG